MEEDVIVITPLLQAKETLDAALVSASDDLHRDGCIQRFEYCYELAWKTMKRFLKAKEIIVHGPKDTFRQAAIVGYIDDPEKWFHFIEMRNSTVHTYNKKIAVAIFNDLSLFQSELEKLIRNLQADEKNPR